MNELGERVFTGRSRRTPAVLSAGAGTTLLFIGSLLCTFASEANALPTASNPAKPCAMLTERMVREQFGIAPAVEVVQKDGSSDRFPTCGYRWRVMSETDEQKARHEYTQKMMANIKAHRSPSEGLRAPQTHATARLTAVRFESHAAAMQALETTYKRMTEGFEFEAAGKERTYEPKESWDPVEGVGDGAYYHGGQLTFVDGDLLMHLDASPLDRATALASKVGP